MSQSEAEATREKLNNLVKMIENLDEQINNNLGDTQQLKARIRNLEIEVRQFKKKLSDAGLD